MAEDQKNPHLVVGSLAGGIEALSRLVSTLPEGSTAPVVIARHLDPERESRLHEILARRSTLPVRTVADHESLEAGVVYVGPSDRHVNVTDSEIDLRVDSRGRPKPSVDLLMSSAAEVFGEGLIAVVLAGVGPDGAEGERDHALDREREARKAVEEREHRYRTLTSNIPGAVFRCVHQKGRPSMEFVSDRIEEITGHPARHFVADRTPSYEDLVHPEDRQKNHREMRRALGLREPYDIEYRLMHAEGGVRWVNERGGGVFSEDGDLLWIDGAIFDVTDRKGAEEALWEYDEWLRLAQRSARSGTWEWDLRSGGLRWSEEHRELFGFGPEEEITLERWWGAVHPDDLSRIEEAGRRCSGGDEEWPEIEYRIVRDGATRWISARGRTIRDEANRPVRVLGISADVTRRKEAEYERNRLLAREWVASAQAAERERISRELHDRVAHSMGVAHQSLQLYEVFAGRDARRAAEKLDLAREMIRAALESTRDLSAELRRLDAEDGLEAELRHLLDVAVPPGIRAGIRVEGDETAVPGHVRGQIFLVLREAVRNAVAHSGCGSVSVGLDIGPEKVTGSVQDDGRGFEAADSDGGVGLRSMKERAALLDGEFDLDCEPGRGTRVAVSVPLTGRSW